MSNIIMVPVCSHCCRIIPDVDTNLRYIYPNICPYCEATLSGFEYITDISKGIHLNTEPSICEKNNELHYV